jgi:hypothetical protein
MSLSRDAASRVSPELSAFIETLVNDPDAEEPITLGDVRRIVTSGLRGEAYEAERVHFESRETVLAEIDALVEQYGEEAPALDFVTVKASDALSRVIEAMMNDPNTPQRPTLGAVRDAMLHGLVARLVGEGAIDSDEDETLLGEVESLIGHHGQDALAEEVLRYEQGE